MDLQKLFTGETVISIKELSPGYENHASDVWLVTTDKREVIVRSSRETNPHDSIFWGGCNTAFGINPMNVHELESVNNVLCCLGSFAVPKVLGKGTLDREYVIVEKLDGVMVQSFVGQPEELLYSLGVGIAKIHSHKLQHTGNPGGTFQVSLENFHNHLADTMAELATKFYPQSPKILKALPEMQHLIRELSPPQYSSFILVDMDPTQFFTDGKSVTGVVDTEAYVLGPRELDFIALEYVLDQQSADIFARGYKTVLEIPDLHWCRRPYRYLYRLIEIQGKTDLDLWLKQPILFT